MPRSRSTPTETKASSSKAAGVRRAAGRVARGTLIAAGLVASQFSYGQKDASFRLFDPAVVDRWSEPLSRHRQ